jgi:uncharacterized membrane protein
MSTVIEAVDVDVPVAAAYNQWTQFETFPEFMRGVDRIEQLDGTHTRWTIDIAGATRASSKTWLTKRVCSIVGSKATCNASKSSSNAVDRKREHGAVISTDPDPSRAHTI